MTFRRRHICVLDSLWALHSVASLSDRSRLVRDTFWMHLDKYYHRKKFLLGALGGVRRGILIRLHGSKWCWWCFWSDQPRNESSCSFKERFFGPSTERTVTTIREQNQWVCQWRGGPLRTCEEKVLFRKGSDDIHTCQSTELFSQKRVFKAQFRIVNQSRLDSPKS